MCLLVLNIHRRKRKREPSNAQGTQPPPLTTDETTIRDIHDILASYYEVARKRFADSVVMQAGFYYLVTGPESPLKLLSSKFIDNLSDEQLETIAGEEPNRKTKRTQLQKQLQDLAAGLKVLR